MLFTVSRLPILITLWIGLLSPAAASAAGVVMGRVADQSGGALPGVAVSLTTEGSTFEQVSDARGEYRFDGVPQGPAIITYTQTGQREPDELTIVKT